MQALITKIIALVMSIISAISAIAVGGCTLSVQKDITTETAVVEYTIKNGSFMKVSCDEYYILEIENEGEWIKVDGFAEANDIAIVLMPLQSYTHKIDVEKDFGHLLDKGKYQLTVKIGSKEISTIFHVE